MTTTAPWLADAPLSFHRRVKWGECDPAAVVYTPRFSDYVADAFDEFMGAMLGRPTQPRLVELDLRTPAKAMHLVFKGSLYPDQGFNIEVRVGGIRNRSFDLQMKAVGDDGREIFDAVMSLVCVHFEVRESRQIPPAFREMLKLYQKRFPEADKK